MILIVFKVRVKLREECAARQADTDALRQVFVILNMFIVYIDRF